MFNRIRGRIGRLLGKFVYKKSVLFPNARKVVSFCFDDFPMSAIDNGARLLMEKNLRGTFYAAFGSAGKDLMPDLLEMVDISLRGHELGCHTFGHLDCSKKALQVIHEDCLKNQRIAYEMAGVKLCSFAYPYGNYRPSTKKMLGKMYESARTVTPDINVGTVDLTALYAVNIYEKGGPLAIKSWAKKLEKNGGWLIFYTHDICNNPSDYGCSIELFSYAIDTCLEAGFEIMTVAKAVEICSFPK